MSLDANRILIPINDSPHSERAFRWACHMARDAKAKLCAIHVLEVPLNLSLEAEVTEDIDRAERLLEKYERIALDEGYKGLEARCLRSRQAGAAVTREAEIEQADLVIVGISYHSTLGQSDLGNTGSYIFQHAACQVLLWREPMPVTSLAGAL